jgi:hypothetical protein
MLQDPKADETQGFKPEWLKHAHPQRGQNLVMLIDAASAKKKTSDYTAAWMYRPRPGQEHLRPRHGAATGFRLTERADLIMAWHRKWQPMAVGYEQYGMMADIEHIKDRQDRENYRFDITPLGGTMPKNDRIRRLIPWFEKGASSCRRSCAKTNYEGRRST